MSRGLLFLVVLACFVAAEPAGANPPDFHLQVVPGIVYKVDDPGNSKTSSFVFYLAAICSTDCEFTPVSAHVELSSGGTIVERQDWTREMLAKIKGTTYRMSEDIPVASPRRVLTLREAFDLPFYFRLPQALAIDSANVSVTVADAKGRRAEQMLKIPIRTYQLKTSLMLPFRGRGIVGQDWGTNGGHGGGISTDFAVDLDGLGQNYEGQTNDDNENASDLGWGREIIAPAAGTVVYARNDVPDNPHPVEPDLNSLAALHDPVMAFAGNCVIVDHGNSEYSVLMHMQRGSVLVKAGDRVAAGQGIGKLGNSGDAFGPHLHYQLQSSPQLFHGQSLPFKFQNVDIPLRRGEYFEAK